MSPTPPVNNSHKKLGIIIGGSGLIGGALLHYFKSKTNDIDILAPNSKRLSLREPEDIKRYFNKFSPDFIINAAIASIDSDPQLAYEVNYMGSVHLARMAAALNIPYIHFSTAAVMPTGENLTEEDRLPLNADLPNYAKSKLMADLTLNEMNKNQGLDYTNIRLAVVYGEHDHKIQGFHRLFYSIANESMLFMLTKPGVMHSYSNCNKLPSFVHHALENREEFSGQTYNFVDRSPVKLAQLILTIKSYLELPVPKEIYPPLPLVKLGKTWLGWIIWGLNRIGIESRMPAELMFLENFYKTQTLSAKKLEKSSFRDPEPETTIFTQLPCLIQYYLTRWEQLNLIMPYNKEFFDPKKKGDLFLNSPRSLLESVSKENIDFSQDSGLSDK